MKTEHIWTYFLIDFFLTWKYRSNMSFHENIHLNKFNTSKDLKCNITWKIFFGSNLLLRNFIEVILMSYFGMLVLLQICCIFSEHLFQRTPLETCFCLLEINGFTMVISQIHDVKTFASDLKQFDRRFWGKLLILWAPTPQNGQTHLNNLLAKADELLERVWPFYEVGA